VEQHESKVRNVLVVEDEPGIAAVCIRTLSREGFQVDIAMDGEVAAEAICPGKPPSHSKNGFIVI
jgi:DNA-binding response OmpR family regulator